MVKIQMRYVGPYQEPHIKEVEEDKVKEFKELGYVEVKLEDKLKAEGLILKKKKEELKDE